MIHTQGYGITMFQDGVDLVNQIKLQDLSFAVPLHVREEQLSSNEEPQSWSNTIDCKGDRVPAGPGSGKGL